MTDQAQGAPEVSVAELKRRIAAGWEALWAYLDSLTLEQITGPNDAAGWTVKDHVAHLAAWEDGIAALLAGKSRLEAMNIDKAMWQQHDYDVMNAKIQADHRDLSWDDVKAHYQRVHERLNAALDALSDADLMRTIETYDVDREPAPFDAHDQDRWVIWYVVGNTFGHYEEHQPWMWAIVNDGEAG
ncbi:MAG: ClbS/DfsB family four-helix bundle protein [bacterium]|nr:ClbS/DfsB family four-helix bundle protein [bacterium]